MAYILLILKNIINGSTIYFTAALSENADALDILALRFLLSFCVFYVLKMLRIVKVDLGIKDFTGKTDRSPYVKYIFLAALFEPVLYMPFETVGITMATGVTVGVILSLSPIASCITEQILLKEKSSMAQKILLAVGIAGVMYIAVNSGSSSGEDSFLGIFMIFLAVVSASVYSAFSRKSASRFTPMEISYFSSLLGMVVFNFVNVVRHLYVGDISAYFLPYFSIENLIGFAFLGVGSTILGTSMHNFAVSRIQLSTVAAFGGVATIATVVIGMFLGEKIYFYHIIGFTLILVRMIGVSYISIKNEKTELQHKVE